MFWKFPTVTSCEFTLLLFKGIRIVQVRRKTVQNVFIKAHFMSL